MTSLRLGSGFPLHSLSAQRDWLQEEAAAGATLGGPGLLSSTPWVVWTALRSLAFMLRVMGGSGLLYSEGNANVV